jgi:hypothetical protein
LSENTWVAGYPAGDAARAGDDGNGLPVAGLVCGLVGLLLFQFVLGPLAVIFGGIGLSRASRGARHKGIAIAALVFGIADLLILAVIIGVAAGSRA